MLSSSRVRTAAGRWVSRSNRMVKFVPWSVNETAGSDCWPSRCGSAARTLLGSSIASINSRGEARLSSRSSAATRTRDIGWLPFSSATAPSEGSRISLYFNLIGGSGYFWSRTQSVRAMPLARSQLIAKVASPRKRGSPPAANDCPGSQNLASPLTARLFNPRSASAPPSAATACLTRSPGLFWASAGGSWPVASSSAAIDKAYFMAAPPLSCCRSLLFVTVALQATRHAVLRWPRPQNLVPGLSRDKVCAAPNLGQLQEPRRIAAHDLFPLERRHPDLVHHLEPLPLERNERGRVGAEQEMVGADGSQAHGSGERRVAR